MKDLVELVIGNGEQQTAMTNVWCDKPKSTLTYPNQRLPNENLAWFWA